MKNYSKLIASACLALLLGACTNEASEPKTLSTPLPLNDVTVEGSQTTQNSTSGSSTDETTTEDNQSQTESTTGITAPDISTTELFVNYMNTLLNTLNSLHASITNNIDLQSQTNDDDMVTSLNVIKDNLFNELEKTKAHIDALPKPDEEVALLQMYVSQAYEYTIEVLQLEYEIVLAADGVDTSATLENSSQVDLNRTTAIDNAKSEISRLSDNAYDSK